MNDKQKFEIQDFLIQIQQIDYASIITILRPIIICYISSKVIDGYYLRKDYKPKNISKVCLPPDLKQEYSNIDIERFASQQFGSAIIHFANVIIDKFPSADLVNFYNNLNELKINPKKFGFQNLVFSSNTAATYEVKKNKIEVDKDNYISTIYHELFHMASSIYKNDISYAGFSQSSQKPGVVCLGKGINEGYTQLLTERYFGDIEEVKGTYKYQVHIVDKLEKIVGREKMESLYLNANLPGLLNELKNYATEEEVANFISSIDFLTERFYDKKKLLFEKGMITNSLKNVNEFLLKTYAQKLKIQLDAGLLSVDELNEQLATYISSLGTSISAGKYSYEFLTIESSLEILKSVLGTPKLTVDDKMQDEIISKGR